MTMSAFDAYKTYLAVNNHFKNKSYDYFKYNGVVKAKENSFISRSDRYFFEKASRKFKQDEFIKYLVSNIIETEDEWIGEMFNNEKQNNHLKWKKRIESITYQFTDEIDKLRNLTDHFDTLFVSSGKSHPLLFRHYLANKISIETMLILDDLIDYVSVWKRKDDIIINKFIFLLQKYRPFFYLYVANKKDTWKKIVIDAWNK
jgi:hypothetical protein